MENETRNTGNDGTNVKDKATEKADDDFKGSILTSSAKKYGVTFYKSSTSCEKVQDNVGRVEHRKIVSNMSIIRMSQNIEQLHERACAKSSLDDSEEVCTMS